MIYNVNYNKDNPFGTEEREEKLKQLIKNGLVKRITLIEGNYPKTQKLWFFPTPLATDGHNSSMPKSIIKRTGIIGELLRAGITGKVNPEWVEYLMGYPIGWTELKD